jgi:hypothetical protein
MIRPSILISTMLLLGPLSCGGQESGTNASTSGEGMTAGSGVAAGSGSGAGTTGGPAGDIGMAAGPAVICAAVQASSYNQACAVDSDCVLTGGNVTGCQCCPYGAINVTALPTYDANLSAALAPFDAGFATCSCGPGPAPSLCCAKGICQIGGACAGTTIVPDIDASEADVAALTDGNTGTDAGACSAPPAAETYSDATASGCEERSTAYGCQGYNLTCYGINVEPDPSSNCAVIPLPTPVGLSEYCCPCSP